MSSPSSGAVERPHGQPPGPFQDIPKWIWVAFFSGWCAIFLLFMALGLPLALSSQGHCDGYKCPDLIQTRSGPMSQRAAAVQIALIPIAAAFGLMAFIVLAK